MLQYSVLIFVWPALLLFLTGPWQVKDMRVNAAVVLLVLIVGTASLVWRRQHFRLFYDSPYRRVLADLRDAAVHRPLAAVVDGDRRMLGWFRNRMKGLPPYRHVDELQGIPGFVRYLREVADTIPFFYLGELSSDPLLLPLTLDRYGDEIWQDPCFLATTRLFSRGAPSYAVPLLLLAARERDTLHWTMKETLTPDTAEVPCFAMDSTATWGPLTILAPDTAGLRPNDGVDLSVLVKPQDSLRGVVLVSELWHRGKRIDWKGTEAGWFAGNIVPGRPGWVRLHHARRLPRRQWRRGLTLRFYLWNKEGRTFLFDSVRVVRLPGNPYLYGRFEPVPTAFPWQEASAVPPCRAPAR